MTLAVPRGYSPRCLSATYGTGNERTDICMRGLLFLIVFVVLLALWVGGFLVYHVAGAMIHLLLIFAVIALIIHFVRRKPSA